MQSGKFNVCVDGMWGSTGKGLIASHLAWKHRPHVLSTTNMANAGHTAVFTDGQKFIAKALPSPSALSKWLLPTTDWAKGEQPYEPTIMVGPSAAFHIEQLLKEQLECNIPDANIAIHERAGVITSEHKTLEGVATKHVASTMQGCGAFAADKIMRKPDLKLARDYPELARFIINPMAFSDYLRTTMDDGHTILHEGSQGFSLDINHGSHYPQCTSRSTTAMQSVTDMGIPPSHIGDIYLVIRPYPIRVGNVVENGEIQGYSGDCYDDQREITWEEVAANSGMPQEEADLLKQKELTTVTKRLRRVFTFSPKQVKHAAWVNGATKIALNFANYVDWSCTTAKKYDDLSDKVKNFIRMVEDACNVPVTLVGTGPKVDDVIEI